MHRDVKFARSSSTLRRFPCIEKAFSTQSGTPVYDLLVNDTHVCPDNEVPPLEIS